MLSVLVVSPHPSVPGGVSVFIEGMKRHLQSCVFDSFYVGSMEGESLPAAIMRLVIAPVQLALLMREKSFDVVHINPSFNVKSLFRDGLLLFALRLIGYRRTLVYFHGWDFGVQQGILGNGISRRIVAWLLNGAAVLTVLGDTFREGLIAIGVDPARITRTRTMFDGDGLTVVRNEPASSMRPFILFMSRFDREKGGRELVKAFAALAPDYPELDLVLAGDGTDMACLRAQVQSIDLGKRVIFTGYVSGADKWRLLRDCSLFALPTFYRSEGMPVSVLEAMGAGKPLLVGAVGALRSIAHDPENGVVLDDITGHTVEQGLRRLLENEAFAASAGACNAETAWKSFEARVVTAEIATLYQRVAQC